MKLGVFAAFATPFATPEGLATLGREAESRGIESLWLPEHVVLFDDYESKYPYDPEGKFPAPPDAGLLEPLSSLAYLAAHTSTVRLATGILLLPQRNPVYTAKEVANIDWLSGGRVDLGIGVGWLAEEFATVNVPFPRRGARADEYIRVLKSLWTDDVSSFQGEFYDLPESRMYPKPVQDPHPPIHVGGESDAALGRVARLGDGWYTFNRTPEQLEEPLATLDELLEAEGRSRADIQLSVCPYLSPLTPDTVVGYREAGVDRVIAVVIGGTPDDIPGSLEALEPCLEAARG